MRKLEYDFEEKFSNEFAFVIDFVKQNEDVFLGIRNNIVDLYVNGGCFFKIEYKYKTNKYIAYYNIDNDKGYYQYLPSKIQGKVKRINKRELTEDTKNEWKKLLPDLKDTVSKYMREHKMGNDKKVSSKEKIVQQKIALTFNNNSNYYTYDMEYNIKELNDYYYLKNGEAEKIKDENGKYVTQTLGRVDNMMISIKNNKVYFYLMEIKEGTNAISNIKATGKYGNGVIGHINSYMQIIDCVKKDEPYKSKYREEKAKVKKETKYIFDIRGLLMDEMLYAMRFYQKFGLIKNPHYKNIDYSKGKLEFGDIEFVLYLSGYNFNSKRFEDHIGLRGNVPYSVKNLINREYRDMKYLYISKNQLYDFKFHKDGKNYDDKNALNKNDLDIEKYSAIRKYVSNGKIEFEVEEYEN